VSKQTCTLRSAYLLNVERPRILYLTLVPVYFIIIVY
jgi:hypothetical protein